MLKEGELRYMWFKLGLNEKDEDNSYLATNFPDGHELPPSYDKKPEHLTTDYLACLREHIIEVLEMKLGKAIVNHSLLEFTVTIPAIWTDKARKLTEKCAKNAGMGDNINVISEPEAAAMHALDVMDAQDLRAGDKYVVCDAGGGTVDIITLEIEKTSKPVELAEVIPGDGHKCGASFLNRRFRKKLIDEYSMLEGWDDDVLKEAEAYFEDYIKKYFSGPEDYKVPIFPLKNNPSKNIVRGRLLLSSADVEAIFAPVVSAAIALLMAQIKKANRVEAVILVGGFSSSPYLRASIKKALPKSVELKIPPYARTAVVRGALLKALSASVPNSAKFNVTTRRARKHYGISVSAGFDPTTHLESKKFWSDYHGDWMVSTMDWLIRKGDNLYENEPMIKTYYICALVAHGLRTGPNEIYAWNGNVAAVHVPRYPKPELVLATLFPHINQIPLHMVPISTGADGKPYYVLTYQIQIKFFSARTEYSLWYRGIRYGTVDAEYC